MSQVPGARRIIIGLSGASGVIYGVRLLEVLRERTDMECHVVMTRIAELTLRVETRYRTNDIEQLAHRLYDCSNLAAAISSGSFRTAGMIVAPCSVRTLGALVNSIDDNLLVRAADVCLKERRPVVLLVRETPLHLGHLRLMAQAAEMGAVILPPVPAFYHRPKTIDDLVLHTVGKSLDQFGIDVQAFRRWQDRMPVSEEAAWPGDGAGIPRQLE
ncbi:MAG: UbiX family flavin prenyltransferase [Candidatus Binatia bacterium]